MNESGLFFLDVMGAGRKREDWGESAKRPSPPTWLAPWSETKPTLVGEPSPNPRPLAVVGKPEKKTPPLSASVPKPTTSGRRRRVQPNP